MDLSKLPRLSKTDPSAAPDAAQAEGAASNIPPLATPEPVTERRVVYTEYAAPGGPEAWISFAMGGLLLLLNPRLLHYLFARSTFETKYPPLLDAQGAPMAYMHTMGFWSDLAITAFCIILILDGFVILLAARHRGLVIAALVLTAITVAGNLAYAVLTFDQGIAMISFVAVFYGVYIAIFQFRLLKMHAQK